jgi:hypothetical protein
MLDRFSWIESENNEVISMVPLINCQGVCRDNGSLLSIGLARFFEEKYIGPGMHNGPSTPRRIGWQLKWGSP